MKITTSVGPDDRSMTIQVEGMHARVDPQTLTGLVDEALTEVLCHLWIPPEPTDDDCPAVCEAPS